MSNAQDAMQQHETHPAARIERDERIAFIVIDNPPVNASSWRVRSDLLAAINACASDQSIDAVVLVGAGKIFMAGADVNEFDAPLQDPQMPAVIAAIEACAKPVVAAIAGAALGAGYEMALACDARIAANDAIVGLPEVSLGVIPGAGGTQRLPRLVGQIAAIDLIANARRVKASEALDAKMIDAITANDLREEAARLALSLVGRKARLRDVAPPQEANEEAEAAAEKIMAKSKGDPAVREAVESIMRSASTPFDEALAAERDAFQRLRNSRQAAAKRYLFFAERDAYRVAGLKGIRPRDVRSTGVVGAGVMGSGIAMCFLDAGYPVTLVERDRETLDAGVARIQATYKRMIASGRLSEEAVAKRLEALGPTISIDELASVDVAVEAVYEDMAVKQAIFRELDRALKPGAILASNTSYLDLDALGRETQRAADVVGLHFFAPANIMRLLEIVRTSETSAGALASALEIAKRLRKIPVVARVGEGFIGNRLYSAYRKQCEFMLEEGALPHQVDEALVRFGFAMGPFAVADLSGLDIAWRTRQRLAASRDSRERYSDILDRLCEAGRLGQKTGNGWYSYPNGARRGVPDDAVTAIIMDASSRKGITRRDMSDDEIVHRALIALINEAALVLSEGIAERASDIDLAMVNGYGFPAREGGPLFFASQESRADLNAWAHSLAEATGFGFRAGDIDSALDRLARKS